MSVVQTWGLSQTGWQYGCNLG